MFRFHLAVVLGFTLAAVPALASGPVGTPVKSASVKSPIQQIGAKMQDQSTKIQSALKAGKITGEQAKALRDGVQAARRKQAECFKKNRKPVLTDAQQAQLNQMLDDNAKKMPDDPFGSKKMPVDPLEKNKMKMPKNSMNKMKLNRPPDPLEKNKAQMPDDPLDAQGAGL